MVTTTTQMLAVQREALTRAIALLKVAQCQYAILAPNGETHGELKVQAEAPRKTRKIKFPNGELRAYYLPLISGMKAGDCKTIEPGSFTAEELRSAISGYCSHAWGNKTYLTHINSGKIEIARII